MLADGADAAVKGNRDLGTSRWQLKMQSAENISAARKSEKE
jgi:hypothetical protein